MSASIDLWQSSADFLLRLNRGITDVVFTDVAAVPLWSNSPTAYATLQGALSSLMIRRSSGQAEVDGTRETDPAGAVRYAFKIRGELGHLLGFIGFAVAEPTPPTLHEMQRSIKPVLDCLQAELDAAQRALPSSPFDAGVTLPMIPERALAQLSGAFAALLLPEQNIHLCRNARGAADDIETGILGRLHRHLLTRAQLHRCTLAANQLRLDESSGALPYKTMSTPVRDATRRVVGVLVVFRSAAAADFQFDDAEALEALARHASQIVLASIDSSTGILTAASFVAQIRAVLDGAAGSTRTHALLHVDIDQLNVINENHGMHVGDEIIRGAAAILLRRAHTGMLAGRLGADRFGVFLPGCGIEPAARIAEEIRCALLKLSGAREERPLTVSTSIGVARIADRMSGLDDALAAAEQACRTAKERGRNRVEVFDGGAELLRATRAARGVQAQIAAAVTAEAYELLVQPVLPLQAAMAEPRYEVLLRLRAADGSRLVQGVPRVAEYDPLARRLDRLVFDRSLERIDACRDSLRRNPAKFYLGWSNASLGDADSWQWLEARLRAARFEPGSLCIEFSEWGASSRLPLILPYMNRLREQGIEFSLNQVGRTLSSLANLRSLPVASVKIDGRICRDLAHGCKSQSKIAAVVSFAQAQGLETIAADVETDAHRERAAALGVDLGQGFFIGKPHALDDALRNLPLYSCFATSTGLIDSAAAAAMLRN